MTDKEEIWLFNEKSKILLFLFFIISSQLISQVTLDSTNLPIIIINTNGQVIPDDPKIEVDMGIIYNGQDELNYITDPCNDYNGVIGIEIRGSTSQNFPKKSYGFETRDTAGNNLNVSLIDLPEENDWILYAPFSDKSLMRNVLLYELSNRIGRYASRTRFCELIINDEYLGVYVLVEKIKQDENRVDIATITCNDTIGDELTGGYIIRLDRFDGDGWFSKYNNLNFYEYYYPDDDQILDCQKQYIEEYFTAFEDSMAVIINTQTNFEELIEVASFIDYIILNELSKNVDAYRLSTYFHKDKTSNGGKLCAGPVWDYNIAFGNCNYYYGYESTNWIVGDTTYIGNHPFWWITLFNSYEFHQQLKSRWIELREGPLNFDSISNIIDSCAIFLNGAQERNFTQWNIMGSYVWPNYFIGNNYQEEVNYLKLWISQRLLWMDENLDYAITTINETKNMEEEVLLFPNPFSNHLTILLKDKRKTLESVSIFNLAGNIVFEQSVISTVTKQNKIELDTYYFRDGYYIYEIHTADSMTLRGKIIKK